MRFLRPPSSVHLGLDPLGSPTPPFARRPFSHPRPDVLQMAPWDTMGSRRTPAELLTIELFVEETKVSRKLKTFRDIQSPISELQALGLISARPTMPPDISNGSPLWLCR